MNNYFDYCIADAWGFRKTRLTIKGDDFRQVILYQWEGPGCWSPVESLTLSVERGDKIKVLLSDPKLYGFSSIDDEEPEYFIMDGTKSELSYSCDDKKNHLNLSNLCAYAGSSGYHPRASALINLLNHIEDLLLPEEVEKEYFDF